MSENIFSSVDNFLTEQFAPEDAALKAVLQSLDDHQIVHMSISPVQGKFLQLMVQLMHAKNILELGTLGGYSTIWMARALPVDGFLLTIESDPKHAQVAEENIARAGLTEKVEVRVGKALDVLPALAEEKAAPFDFIFIDADKPPYKEYFDWAVKLSRPGTCIIVDNVVRGGKILDANSDDPAVRGVLRLLESLRDRDDVSVTVLQQVGVKEHDGMLMAVVK